MDRLENMASTVGYRIQQAAIPFSVGVLGGYLCILLKPLRLGAFSGVIHMVYEICKQILSKQGFSWDYQRKLGEYKHGLLLLKAGGYITAGGIVYTGSLLLGSPLSPGAALIAAFAAAMGQYANEKMTNHLANLYNPHQEANKKQLEEIKTQKEALKTEEEKINKLRLEFEESQLYCKKLETNLKKDKERLEADIAANFQAELQIEKEKMELERAQRELRDRE